MADHLRADLVVEAMKQAIATRRHTVGLMLLRLRLTPSGQPVGWLSRCARLHGDCSSQYGSRAFRDALHLAGLRPSMSARANLYHNAWTKSLMGPLKAEMLQNGRFINASDVRAEIFASSPL